MSVFDDDEDEKEEGTAGARVAAALNPQQEEEPADDGPDTRAASQQDAKQQAKDDAPNDHTAQEVASYEGTSEPEQIETGSEEPAATTSDDQDLQQLAGYTPIKAPQAPTLKPYSTAPVEAAQELANAKSSFDPSQYKPSVGRRIAASLASGLVGFGTHNASEAMSVGDQMRGRPLENAKRVEGQKEAGIQSRIDAGNTENAATEIQNKNALNQYNLEERGMRNQGYVEAQQALASDRRSRAQDRDNAIVQFTPADPNDPYKGGTGVTAAGKTVQNVAPPDKWLQQWERDPKNKATAEAGAGLAKLKQMKAAGLKLSPEQESIVASGGKITAATHIHVPSAAQEEYNDWKTAFAKEHGRAPNAAEIAAKGHVAAGSMTKNLADRILSQKNTKINQAEKDYNSGLIDKDEYLDRWQAAQDDFEERIGTATGEDVHHVTVRDNVDPNTLKWHGEAPAQSQQPSAMQQHAQQSAQPQQQAAPQQASAGQKTFQYKGATYSQGQQIMVNGKPAVVTGINPQTGKLQVQAQGQ